MSLKTLETKSTHTPPFSWEWTHSRTGWEGGLGWLSGFCMFSVSEYHYSYIPPTHSSFLHSVFHHCCLVVWVWNVWTPVPSLWHVLGGVEPLKREVWLVKMSHCEWTFEGHRLAGALLASWFLNTSQTMDWVPATMTFPTVRQFVIVMRQELTVHQSIQKQQQIKQKFNLSVPSLLRKHQIHRRPGKAHTGIWPSEYFRALSL